MHKKFINLPSFVIFVLIPLVFLAFFQNCGKKFQSEISLFSSSNSNSGNSLVPNGPPKDGGEESTLPLKFGDVEVNEVFRGDVIKIKISKRDPAFPDNFKITSISANATALRDFIPFEKQLTIDPNSRSVDLQIDTLITEPFADNKLLTLKIDFTHFSETKSFIKKILIKSRYEPVRYKAIKAGYSHMCGLGFDNELYCWGSLSGSRLFFSTDRQPFRIKSGTTDSINFDSLQIADSHTCFKLVPSNRVRCFGNSTLNAVSVSNVSLGEVTLSANSQLIEQPVKEFAAAGYMVYFITNDGQLFSRNLNNLGSAAAVTTLINSGTKYLKIFANGYSGAIAVNEAGVFELNSGDAAAATSKLPQFASRLDYRDIVHSDSRNFFTIDNKQVTKPGSNDIYVAVDLPAPAKSFSSGVTTNCYTTLENKLYCRTNSGAFQQMADLTVQKLSPDTAAVRTGTICSLTLTGNLKCLGTDTGGYYTGSFGFAKNAANLDYVDVSEEQIRDYESFIFKPSYNPIFSTSTNEINCKIDNYQVLNCKNLISTPSADVKIFGNHRIKMSTLKAYARDSTVFVETLSGRRLAYNYSFESSQLEFFTVHKIISGQEMVVPGPINTSCPDGMTIIADGCQLATTVTAGIANPARVVNFPNASDTIDFDIVLTRAIPVDVIFFVEPDRTRCNGNPNLSSSCFPQLLEQCDLNSCQSTDYTASWAETRTGATFNRFDWNYDQIQKFVIFKAGETRSRYSLKISKDFRKEQNKIIHLKLTSTMANVSFSDSMQILLRKAQNPEPLSGVQTFAQLMDRRSGILGLNCVKCHNSVDLAGGYDMTNYDLMVSRGVINLSNPLQSKMYQRISPDVGNLAKPMPLDGFLDINKIVEIQKWLQNGAKNN